MTKDLAILLKTYDSGPTAVLVLSVTAPSKIPIRPEIEPLRTLGPRIYSGSLAAAAE